MLIIHFEESVFGCFYLVTRHAYEVPVFDDVFLYCT